MKDIKKISLLYLNLLLVSFDPGISNWGQGLCWTDQLGCNC